MSMHTSYTTNHYIIDIKATKADHKRLLEYCQTGRLNELQDLLDKTANLNIEFSDGVSLACIYVCSLSDMTCLL